jgi:aryl-alcohol dehydrogenase-like predicted oxidoreductase
LLTYGSVYGDNEEVLSKWFQRTGKRDQIFLASKFGLVMDGMQFKGINSSAAYCKAACEKSLQRLGVQWIDLCELFVVPS